MTDRKLPNRTLEDVRIIFRNFSGAGDAFNAEGNRNFNIILDDADAEAMRADGWNVKTKEPREEGDDPLHLLKVDVSYKARPPRVVMITSRGRTNLDEAGVGALDWVNIKQTDLILNPYAWTVNGKSGIKAYLHSIYVTIEEDALEKKYSGIEDATAGRNSIPDPDDEWRR